VLSVPFANKLEIVNKLVEIVVAEILQAVIEPLLIVLVEIAETVKRPVSTSEPTVREAK